MKNPYTVTKTRQVNIGNQTVEVFDQPIISGPTDGVQFAGHAVRACGQAKIGDMCRCGKERLTNIIAEQEPSVKSRLVVVKCYSCGCAFIAPYPTAIADN